MKFIPTAVQGVFIIQLEPVEDERGYFARTWCREEFRNQGLDPALEQCNLSFNRHRGTVRGLHYQAPPGEEAKLVRCSRGSLFDVALDLRVFSPTFLKYAGVVLDADIHHALYIPAGCAHGFQTLEDATEVTYQMSRSYAPELARGVRWDDPVFDIRWPQQLTVISDRDRNYADFVLPARTAV
jgi:dTDP-4-dehydrorhamnose 3,5-epimerase